MRLAFDSLAGADAENGRDWEVEARRREVEEEEEATRPGGTSGEQCTRRDGTVHTSCGSLECYS